MKIRNGFVSNSSSSSFVIIGYSLKDIASDEESKREIINRLAPNMELTTYFHDDWENFLNRGGFGKDISYLSDDLSDDGEGYIGIILADISSEDTLAHTERPLSDIIKNVEKIKIILETDLEPKIITGTMAC